MLVDAHQHFWKLARGDYRWLTPDLAAIHRDFEPRDLAPHLQRWGIERTILVQAADSLAETRFLLELARSTPFVAGVVGWIDMEARDALEQLDALASDRNLVGIRPMIQDIADERWMLRAELTPVLRELAKRGLVFDALVKPQHLAPLRALLAQHPDLRVVIDHAAKPRLPASGTQWSGFEAWSAAMRNIARETRAVVKLSGLLTEAAAACGVANLRPILDCLLDSFGAERMLWGSDWPVVELAGGYDRWRELTLDLLRQHTEHERAMILGETAARIYRIRANHLDSGEAKLGSPSSKKGT